MDSVTHVAEEDKITARYLGTMDVPSVTATISARSRILHLLKTAVGTIGKFVVTYHHLNLQPLAFGIIIIIKTANSST